MEGLASGTINFLLLPVLGGYWFQYKFTLTHYRAERLTNQRLIWHAGLYALCLVAIAKLIVFVAELAEHSEGPRIASALLSALLGVMGLTMTALAAMALKQYRPNANGDSAALVNQNDDLPAQSELWRSLLGAVVVIILVALVAAIYASIPSASRLPTELSAVGVYVVLLALTKWQHYFINQFIEFPFFSIALRIGFFGVVASLALAWFIFDYPALVAGWAILVNVPGSGIAVMACLLGLVLWWPLNLLYPYKAANTRLHYANGTTALDRLLYQSSLAQNLLCLSMNDGKVYIGYIQELPPNPEDRNSYLEILPVQSGYRDKDTREMKLTTFYESAYTKLVKSEADEEEWFVFLKILKIEDILSAGRFDPEAFVLFNTKADETLKSKEDILTDIQSG